MQGGRETVGPGAVRGEHRPHGPAVVLDRPGDELAQQAARIAISATVLCVVLAPWVTPQAASAHDPGQGEDAGTLALDIRVADGRATLRARVAGASCSRTEPVAIVARRGGEALRGPLRKDGCSMTGALTLPTRGRWFVYAELRQGRARVESWLPVSVDDDGHGAASADVRYAYIPAQRSGSALKLVGGIVLYAAILALLFAALRLIQAGRRDVPRATAA